MRGVHGYFMDLDGPGSSASSQPLRSGGLQVGVSRAVLKKPDFDLGVI